MGEVADVCAECVGEGGGVGVRVRVSSRSDAGDLEELQNAAQHSRT